MSENPQRLTRFDADGAREPMSCLTDAQRSALGLPVGDAQRRANNTALFGRLASAAARSNRPDAAQLSAHYAKRATR